MARSGLPRLAPGVLSWKFAHKSDAALALLVGAPRSHVPAKGVAQAFVDSTDQSMAASTCRRPTRPSSRLQGRGVARRSQVDSYGQAAPAGRWSGSRSTARAAPSRNTTETATGAIRAIAVSLLAEPRHRGGENRTAALENDGRHCLDGAKAGAVLCQTHRRDASLRRCEGGLECSLLMLSELLLDIRWEPGRG